LKLVAAFAAFAASSFFERNIHENKD